MKGLKIIYKNEQDILAYFKRKFTGWNKKFANTPEKLDVIKMEYTKMSINAWMRFG